MCRWRTSTKAEGDGELSFMELGICLHDVSEYLQIACPSRMEWKGSQNPEEPPGISGRKSSAIERIVGFCLHEVGALKFDQDLAIRLLHSDDQNQDASSQHRKSREKLERKIFPRGFKEQAGDWRPRLERESVRAASIRSVQYRHTRLPTRPLIDCVPTTVATPSVPKICVRTLEMGTRVTTIPKKHSVFELTQGIRR